MLTYRTKILLFTQGWIGAYAEESASERDLCFNEQRIYFHDCGGKPLDRDGCWRNSTVCAWTNRVKAVTQKAGESVFYVTIVSAAVRCAIEDLGVGEQSR